MRREDRFCCRMQDCARLTCRLIFDNSIFGGATVRQQLWCNWVQKWYFVAKVVSHSRGKPIFATKRKQKPGFLLQKSGGLAKNRANSRNLAATNFDNSGAKRRTTPARCNGGRGVMRERNGVRRGPFKRRPLRASQLRLRVALPAKYPDQAATSPPTCRCCRRGRASEVARRPIDGRVQSPLRID